MYIVHYTSIVIDCLASLGAWVQGRYCPHGGRGIYFDSPKTHSRYSLALAQRYCAFNCDNNKDCTYADLEYSLSRQRCVHNTAHENCNIWRESASNIDESHYLYKKGTT